MKKKSSNISRIILFIAEMFFFQNQKYDKNSNFAVWCFLLRSLLKNLFSNYINAFLMGLYLKS